MFLEGHLIITDNNNFGIWIVIEVPDGRPSGGSGRPINGAIKSVGCPTGDDLRAAVEIKIGDSSKIG